MFVGAVPKEFIAQILDVVPFDQWGGVHVCCSGSFRPEVALRQRYPDLPIVGNDVSLLSVAIGELAVGRLLEFRFRERLAPLEEILAGCDQTDRVAVVLIAQEMAVYRGRNAHAQGMFEHYLAHFEAFLAPARDKLVTLVRDLASTDFFAGDFRVHAARAAAAGAGILAFPPTYKNGYERIYKFLGDNVEWAQPPYDIWDPAELEEWLRGIDDAGQRYCVLADRLLPSFTPAIRYDNASGRKTVWGYTDQSGSSLRGKSAAEVPFQYRAVQPARLGPKTQVSLVQVEAGHMTFLKNQYLARGIKHVPGMLNFLVMLGDELAGGFIYSRSRMNPETELYLLSDFSIVREGRIAKLVALLATSRLAVDVARKRFMSPLDEIWTTVFTDKPVSMKYRGVFELKARKPGFLQYMSPIRNETPNELYREWFKRYGRSAQARNAGQKGADQPAREAA